MMRFRQYPLVTLIIVVWVSCALCSCQQSANSSPMATTVSTDVDKEFGQYWYAGKAEISAYTLKQSRYGEVHEGDAVLIFVTEPFSTSKQVKLDYPGQAGEDNVSVLKLNYLKKFNTGIYPYSMMLSSFTPVNTDQHSKTLKVTTSVQEWCGQIFTQMNLDNDKYRVKAYSYFEAEGDESFNVKHAILEDEIFNRIRLNHTSLPTGDFEMIPGLFYTRLRHSKVEIVKVNAQLEEEDEGFNYTLNFNKGERILKITFQRQFPHQILGWKEDYKGIGGRHLTTSATLKKSLYTAYWSQNSTRDIYLRDSLGLKF